MVEDEEFYQVAKFQVTIPSHSTKKIGSNDIFPNFGIFLPNFDPHAQILGKSNPKFRM